MRHMACLGLVAALAAAAGGGCDYGTAAPEDGASIESSLRVPGQPLTQGNPGISVSPDKSSTTVADDSGDPDPDPAAAPVVVDRAPSADCIDFSSGMARLVLCNTRGSLTNPIGHDDPDPWRPAPTPTTPY